MPVSRLLRIYVCLTPDYLPILKIGLDFSTSVAQHPQDNKEEIAIRVYLRITTEGMLFVEYSLSFKCLAILFKCDITLKINLFDWPKLFLCSD